MGRRLSYKQRKKRAEKKCRFCGEDNYNVLDVHRIIPELKGGKYKDNNAVVVCCHCHRRIHADEIIIDRYYNSTKGKLLHYFENGEEFWK
jgi:hypothetical protein